MVECLLQALHIFKMMNGTGKEVGRSEACRPRLMSNKKIEEEELCCNEQMGGSRSCKGAVHTVELAHRNNCRYLIAFVPFSISLVTSQNEEKSRRLVRFHEKNEFIVFAIGISLQIWGHYTLFRDDIETPYKP